MSIFPFPAKLRSISNSIYLACSPRFWRKLSILIWRPVLDYEFRDIWLVHRDIA